MKNKKNYIIGLDVGTTSVGWAVVDPKTYKVLDKNKKSLWGVSLFDEAEPAKKRREFRSTRRRYDRRRKRIEYLQDEFRNEISKVDPMFFTKLKESFYNDEDHSNKTVRVSKSERESQKKYQSKYKTIYHLRNELVNSKDKFDIRLVYLALHHMIKYRGNFLYNGNFNVNNVNIPEKLYEIFESFCNNVENVNIDEYFSKILDESVIHNTFNIEYKKDKEKQIKVYFSKIMDIKPAKEFAKALTGYKFNVADLFNVENEEKLSISFSGTDYEDKFDEIESILGNNIEILSMIKDLYDMLFLKDLFKGEDSISISSLMVKRYEKHQHDLKLLKDELQKNRTEYNKILRTCDSKKNYICFYDKYVNNKITYDEFTREILKYIDVNNNCYLVNEIESGKFLPKITSVENGKFPFQLNKYEMEKILENQSKYYPFLINKASDVDGDKCRIIKLLEFRIPYYVGPLNDTTNLKNVKNKNAWLIKNNTDTITPFNFNEVINLDATAQVFIQRMLSNCTYLLKEKCMPSNSLLYSEYKVLNELKQIKVNNDKLDLDFINYVVENLFKKTSGTITDKVFIKFLYSTQEYRIFDNIEVTGYSDNKKFANNLQSYYDFFNENDGFLTNLTCSYEKKYQIAENIIKYITVFEDKDILERKVKMEYPQLGDKVISRIKNKKYKGWSRLSEKLLTNKYYKDLSDSVYKSIMDLMRNTPDNFMQIISNKKYGFQKFIQEENKSTNKKVLDYSVVEELSTSPSNKKGIYQTLKVVQDIVEYMGYEPESIVLEMAKGPGEKKRTENKKNQLIQLYEKNKNSIEKYNELMKELKGFEKIDSKKMFLYFIQEGRSLYSNEKIDIDDLSKCEIDHIIPQSLIKDDSIDNLALVKREENQIKRDSLVLPYEYRNSLNITWWKSLKDKKLISAKKMYNLMRKNYSKDDVEGFINRQLVETRQITKHVANIIHSYYQDTNVFYINANLSSNYRSKFKLPKFRDLNDYHHAHDAYLAAVLGEYKQHHFKNEIDLNMLSELNKVFIKNNEFNKLKYGFIINSLDNDIFYDYETGEIVEIKNKKGNFDFNNENFNQTIKYNLLRNDILVSKKTEIKTGKFYKETIFGKNSSEVKNGISIKENFDKHMYGVYSSNYSGYMCLVQYGNKAKLVGIPLIVDAKSAAKKDEFIREHLNMKDSESFKILKDKIPFNTLINYKGHICRISGYSNAGKSNELINAYQFKVRKDLYIKWNKSMIRIFKGVVDNEYTNYTNDFIEIYDYIINFINLNYPLYENLIYNLKSEIDFCSLDDESKVRLIKELINMMKCNGSNACLKFLNLKFDDRVGRIKGKSITEGTLIFQSPTGLRETYYQIGEKKHEF